VPTTNLWSKGGQYYGYFEIQGEGAVIQASDEPARGPNVAACAEEIGQLLSDTVPGYLERSLTTCEVLGSPDGLERHYEIASAEGRTPWFDRYLQRRDRWIVIRSPERAREVANGIALDTDEGNAGRFVVAFVADVPSGWNISERLEFVRSESNHRITAQSFPLPGGVAETWIEGQVTLLNTQPGYALVDRREGSFLGRLPARVLTYRSPNGEVHNLLRVWLGAIEGRGYRLLVSLPERERGLGFISNHNLVAGHVVLRDQSSNPLPLANLPLLTNLRRYLRP
jgi:hypothetical protein